ncbi:PREDICTED: craniofacial development protein 2-like [Nicotiana attenuata]|uniref:craniofacial development protein 2-like n=1 Tax=Nicotiana attenuata TaxID=49451 RepID=UPI0009054F70|nr:PREDICTED: craniofacial development protein 2-like [Nicotiana attenuata]
MARNMDGYKLWYSGVVRGKNEVGILVDRDLRESVVEVRRMHDRLMFIKLMIGECTFNVLSDYAPQAGLDEEVKRRFWESLDEVVRSIPPTERLFIGGDFNGHIGRLLVTMARCMVASALGLGMEEIDYLLLRRCDRGLCKDCKVVPGETLVTQHRLLVMDVGIMIRRKKRYARGQPRIRWGALPKDKAQELEGRLLAMGAWKSSEDASAMWATTANCVREAAKEVLGISKGHSGRHQGDW